VLVGPEPFGDEEESDRFLSDTILTWAVGPRLSLMANYDYAQVDTNAGELTWSGVALYGRVQVTEVLAFSPRVEWFDDPDGAATGVVQTLREVTLTTELKLAGGLLTRLELRRDVSDVDFFEDGGRMTDSQDTVTLGLIYAFARSF
jgi:hypothetical protein